MLKLVCISLFVVVAMSGLCPTWDCSNDQTDTGDYHCVEFKDSKWLLADQATVCKGTDKECLLYQAVYEINYFSSVTVTSYCTSQSTSGYDYYFLVPTDQTYGTYYYSTQSYYVPVETGCVEYATYYAYCVANLDEEYAEEVEEDIDELQAEVSGSYTWNTCSSHSDCEVDVCLCVPSSNTDGRCGTSELDKQIIDIAQIAASCDKDENSVCTLNLFYDSYTAVLWTSILENDLSCADAQAWELTKKNDYHLQDAMDWYNKANAQIIILMTGALLSLL